MDEQGRTAKQIARSWWHEQLEEGGEVDIKALSVIAVEVLSVDMDFRESFVDEFLPSVMYDMGQRILATRRTALRTTQALRRQVEKDAKAQADKWEEWLEYVPGQHSWMPLPSMNRSQLESAAANRDKLAKSNQHESIFLSTIAKGLNAKQIVSDVYTDGQITSLRQSLIPSEVIVDPDPEGV